MDDQRIKVRINQVWQSVQSGMRVEIIGKKGDKWQTRVLTDRHGVYAGTHTLTIHTLRSKYRPVTREELQGELDNQLAMT